MFERYTIPLSLSFIFYLLPSLLFFFFLLLFASFPAVTLNADLKPPGCVNVELCATLDNNRPPGRICLNYGSDGDSRDLLEAPRLRGFIHDNGFLETLIELRV